MGRFIIFIAVFLLLTLLGLGLWWIGNKIYIHIKRDIRMFDIEDEAYKKVVKEIKKDEKEN